MFVRSTKCGKPCGIAFDSRNQNIITSNGDNHKIQIFDRKMNYLKSFGTWGYKHGQFNSISGICVQNATNNIVITERDNHRVQVISNINDESEELQSLYLIGGPHPDKEYGKFYWPWGVACNNKGHMIITDYANSRVQILNEKGCFIRQMGEQSGITKYLSPIKACVNKHNQIIIITYIYKYIMIFSGDGLQHLRDVNLNDNPRCVTTDNFGNIIVGFANGISVFDANNFNQLYSFGENTITDGLCVTDNNNLITCEYSGDCIVEYTLKN